MKNRQRYTFKDPDLDPAPSCSSQGWEFIEYDDYKPGDLLRGNLWIQHGSRPYWHKVEVLGDGTLSEYGRPTGNVSDLEEYRS